VAEVAVEHSRPHPVRIRRRHLVRVATGSVLSAIFVGNLAAIVWLWWHGGNVLGVHGSGEWLTSFARITGLLGAYSALLEVMLLARLPWLERLVGFDRLSVWHRWNGHACLYLVLAHVVLSVWGYALMDRLSIPKEISTMLGGGIYPGMITATVGTGLLIAVVGLSIVVVRRRLPYEAWYTVHLTAYASIALAWFHQIPTGNELVLDRAAADYWRALYLATLGALVVFRVIVPIANGFRYRLRVAEVVTEGPGVVSLRIVGRNLDRLGAQAGQFFLWRFLGRGRWWSSHPFSLSESPDGRSLRVTVKALGDFTHRLGAIQPGTRVLTEGPFGVFTADVKRQSKVLLIAGGIGITPIRALMEEIGRDAIVVFRVLRAEEIVLQAELEALAKDRSITLHYAVGDHRTAEGRDHLSPAHLRELVPDLLERDVYVCGPPGLTDVVETNVRSAGVPRRFIHTERFAL
jgi:predicted ferric reductase